jgi:hypothetical protein
MVSDHIALISLYCTLFIILIMLPVYSALSHYYGTHTFEYAWAVSAAYLNGFVTLRLLLALFTFLLVLLLYWYREMFNTMRRFLYHLPKDFNFSVLDDFHEEEEEEMMKKNRYSSFYDKLIVYAAFFLINVVVVAGVNTAYVYAAIYSRSVYLTLAQISLSLFKIIWGNFGAVYLIRWTHHYLASSATKDWKSKSVGFFTIQLFVSLFNFILVPCFVVACISPDCFNNVVVPAPTVTATYYYEDCSLFTVLYGCQAYTPRTATTSYNPPFTYSYECSSSLITFYAPTFVYMGFIVAFICPFWDWVMTRAHEHVPRGTWAYGQIHFWVPVALHHTTVESSDNDLPYDIFNPYYDANYILVCVCSYLGVLLTFGFVFPPLALVMLVTIYSIVWETKLKVGRFLSNAIELNIHKYTDIIDGECQGVGSIPKLQLCLRMVVVFACLFYTPFLFDILGDSVGIDASIWVIIVVPLLPLLFPLVYMAYYQYYKKHTGRTGSQFRTSSAELRDSNFLRSKHAEKMLSDAMASELHSIEHKPRDSDTSDPQASDDDQSSGAHDDFVTFNVLRQPSTNSNTPATRLSNLRATNELQRPSSALRPSENVLQSNAAHVPDENL